MQNRLTIIREFQKPGKNRSYAHYLCKCECGNTTEIYKYRYLDGSTISCGCYATEKLIQRSTTHNMSYSRLYGIYCGIITRIHTETDAAYPNYGGRGIQICQDWDCKLLGRTEAFKNFENWASSHGYQDDLVIDRINSDGNYYPNNCRFITMAKSNRNKRSVKLYEYKGQSKILVEWAVDSICKVGIYTLRSRIKSGWDMEKALTTPCMGHNK